MPAGWSERCGNRSLIDVRESDRVRWTAQWVDAIKTQCLKVDVLRDVEAPGRATQRNVTAKPKLLLACGLRQSS
jgi:hypothetical protein